MIKLTNMLMVGAMQRNVGKTEFACAIISKFSSQRDIVGIKVTTIEKANSGCPRGGDGCGVCSSLDGSYYITEETDSHVSKDTSRMLAAGAGKVFWIRALATHLRQATEALLEIIGTDTVMLCESNSLRNVVEPGLFFIVKAGDQKGCKPSAKSVLKYADRKISYDGDSFDIDLEDIALIEGNWTAKIEATAIIMAGGNSKRMGRDKSMLLVRGKPVIEHIAEQLRPHFDQILISSNDADKYGFLGLEVIPDKKTGLGPLMGITCALKASANEVNFVIACDIPEVDISIVRNMIRLAEDADVVMPRVAKTMFEPLFAVYKKNIVPLMQDALESGITKIIVPLENCKVGYLDFSKEQISALKNLNTIADYQTYLDKTND